MDTGAELTLQIVRAAADAASARARILPSRGHPPVTL